MADADDSDDNARPAELVRRLEITVDTAGSLSEGDAFFRGTRESWFGSVIQVWRPYFERAGAPLPLRIYVSVGRPARGTSTGVCFPGYASDDGSPHIFVHPVIVDPYRVAGTVVHQCCHAALGSRSHGIRFRLVAIKVGLVGKPTATIEGPLFHELVPKVIEKAGPYPHSALRQIRGMNPPKKSRMVRARCLKCGYVIRLAQKWIDLSHPLCPNKHCSNMGNEMEVG